MEEGSRTTRPRLTTIWEERRVIVICLCIAFAQFQYGYDSAAVSGFQSMPGFLRVYGYPDVWKFLKLLSSFTMHSALFWADVYCCP